MLEVDPRPLETVDLAGAHPAEETHDVIIAIVGPHPVEDHAELEDLGAGDRTNPRVAERRDEAPGDGAVNGNAIGMMQLDFVLGDPRRREFAEGRRDRDGLGCGLGWRRYRALLVTGGAARRDEVTHRRRHRVGGSVIRLLDEAGEHPARRGVPRSPGPCKNPGHRFGHRMVTRPNKNGLPEGKPSI